MNIDITPEEKMIIEELLHRYLASLPIEIHHCRTGEFKVHLKEREKLIQELVLKLK